MTTTARTEKSQEQGASAEFPMRVEGDSNIWDIFHCFFPILVGNWLRTGTAGIGAGSIMG